MAGNLNTVYATATTKAAVDGKGAPSAHNGLALTTWVANRSGPALKSAQALADWINSYSPTSTGVTYYTTPGNYSFTVPTYNSLSVAVSGAGGGGGGSSSSGGGGGFSSFSGLAAGGGYGGSTESASPGNGAQGFGSGGSSNITGGGSAGGQGSITVYSDKSGNNTSLYGGAGGAGGYSSQTYAQGALTPGSVISVTVGTAGAVGTGIGGLRNATAGTNGAVTITWT